LLVVPLADVPRTVIEPLHNGKKTPKEMFCVQLIVGAALNIFDGTANTAKDETQANACFLVIIDQQPSS
jgi:hypothetical protein